MQLDYLYQYRGSNPDDSVREARAEHVTTTNIVHTGAILTGLEPVTYRLTAGCSAN